MDSVSDDIIQKIIVVLSVKELAKLSMVNKEFRTICMKESLWRRKVLSDYGVDKRYELTWKATAITMDKLKMINLSKRWWINNLISYGEMLDSMLSDQDNLSYSMLENVETKRREKTLQSMDIKRTSHDPNLYKCKDKYYVNDAQLNALLLDVWGETETQWLLIKTVVCAILAKCIPSRSESIFSSNNNTFKSPIIHMIDPILLVMQFSAYSRSELLTALEVYKELLK